MKNTVINKFVDNKIRTAYCSKKNTFEVLDMLERRIETTEKSDNLSEHFKEYMISFTKKRINDILTIKSNRRFNSISDNKVLNLIVLKDKLEGLQEFEIQRPTI